MSELPVNFLPDQNYDCVQCGRGCVTPWNITVAKECVEGLQGSQLLKDVTARYGEPFRFAPERGQRVLNRKANGHCVFLAGDEGPGTGCLSCSIHADLGYATKPTTCKNFPFLVVRTPGELRVSASFYCTAVQQNRGRPLSAHHDALKDFGEGEILQVGQQPIVVYEDRTIPWEGYKSLVDFLESPQEGASYEARLVRALLALCQTILATPAGEQVQPERLRQALHKSTPVLSDTAWFREYVSTCLHGVTIYLECDQPEEIRAIQEVMFIGQTMRLPASNWSGTADDLAIYRAAPLTAELQQHVDRYMKAVLFRHYLATHGPVLQSLFCLYLNSNLIRQYSRMLAEVAQEPLNGKFLFGAIDKCEHDLMLHGLGFKTLWSAFTQSLLAQIACQ